MKLVIKVNGVVVTDVKEKIALIEGKKDSLVQEIFDGEIPTWYGSQEVSRLDDILIELKKEL